METINPENQVDIDKNNFFIVKKDTLIGILVLIVLLTIVAVICIANIK